MEEIKKLEKTIDMDALIRWLLRKWKSGFLVILTAAVVGGGLGVLRMEETGERALTEKENDELEEYFRYDVYIEEMLDIIGLLEEDIEGSLGTVADTKVINERVLELADKMELLQTYKSYYSSILSAQYNLREDYNEAQNLYIDRLKAEGGKAAGKEVEENEKITKKIKSGVKTGVLLGLIAAGVWAFAHIFIFGLNKKIKSKEDVLAICGELSVLEGKRGIIKTDKVQIGSNLGLKNFLSQEELGIVTLTEKKTTFDMDICNDKLAESLEKDMTEDVKVVLIVEIGVSRYEDVVKMKERCGDRLTACLCIG